MSTVDMLTTRWWPGTTVLVALLVLVLGGCGGDRDAMTTPPPADPEACADCRRLEAQLEECQNVAAELRYQMGVRDNIIEWLRSQPPPLTARPVPYVQNTPFGGGRADEWQGWAELAAAITELASVAGPAEIVARIEDEIPGLTVLQDELAGECLIMSEESRRTPPYRRVQLLFLGPVEVGGTVGDNLILSYDLDSGRFTLHVGSGRQWVRHEGVGDTARIERWVESYRHFWSEQVRD